MTQNQNSTADRILDTTQSLIQNSGYSAISFSDIADIVGIKKPSIIHHFPSKAALGQAVVQRYHKKIKSNLDQLAQSSDDKLKTITDYISLYQDAYETDDKVCLCGALSGEFVALPASIQQEITSFFQYHINWLDIQLQQGRQGKLFHFQQSTHDMAIFIVDYLQGAIIVKRAAKKNQSFEQIMALILSIVGSTSAP